MATESSTAVMIRMMMMMTMAMLMMTRMAAGANATNNGWSLHNDRITATTNTHRTTDADYILV